MYRGDIRMMRVIQDVDQEDRERIPHQALAEGLDVHIQFMDLSAPGTAKLC